MGRFCLICATCIPLLLSTNAVVEDALEQTLVPAERPYPYAIFGVQPGDYLNNIQSVFEERMAIELVPRRSKSASSPQTVRIFRRPMSIIY